MPEVGQVGVLRREQPVLLGLGFRPRSRELLERGRCSARPELHREHARNGAVPEPAGGQVAEQSHDTLELLRVPAIVEAVARSGPRWWILLADDRRGDACGLTGLACPEVAPDTGQHDRLAIRVLRGLHLPVRGLRHDPERDPALRAEAANLLEVHVVQLLEEPRLLDFRQHRQEVRHPRPLTCFRAIGRKGTAAESVLVSSRYRRATSEFHRLSGRPRHPREPVVERLQLRQYGKERGAGHWFDNQPSSLFAQRRGAPRELEVTRDSESLIASVSEKSHLAFRVLHQPSPIALAYVVPILRLGPAITRP